MPYVPHTPEDIRRMLDVIGAPSVASLFDEISPAMRPKSFDLPEGKSEMDVLAHMEALAKENVCGQVSFLGAGFYDHHIPAAVEPCPCAASSTPPTRRTSPRPARARSRPSSSTRRP
jgi:Glycine cleavage system protein P (pyridoxal-binding), N-terminal domain